MFSDLYYTKQLCLCQAILQAFLFKFSLTWLNLYAILELHRKTNGDVKLWLLVKESITSVICGV